MCEFLLLLSFFSSLELNRREDEEEEEYALPLLLLFFIFACECVSGVRMKSKSILEPRRNIPPNWKNEEKED